MRVEYGQLVEIDFTHQIYAWVLAVGAVACILLFIFNKISCFSGRRAPDEDGGTGFDGATSGTCCGMLCCQTILDSLCALKDKDIFETEYAETVKSMDISDSGCESRHLPVEVNSAALATAQFLQAESNLTQLSAGDRARLAENRQVMRAYLISKLVAPRYSVDTHGKMLAEQPRRGHLDRFEFHERQSAMFHLVFNGHISVDTRATKRQQREAIRRLKRCTKERHLEKHDKVSSKVSISEKETSGVGTDLNSNPPISPTKGTKRHNDKDKKKDKVKRSNSGTSESSANSRRQPILQRIASAIKLKSPDSAVGSSIGQYDADIESMDRGRRESANQNLQPVMEHQEDIELHFEGEKKEPEVQRRTLRKQSQVSMSTVQSSTLQSETSTLCKVQRSQSASHKTSALKLSHLPTKWSSAIDLPVPE